MDTNNSIANNASLPNTTRSVTEATRSALGRKVGILSQVKKFFCDIGKSIADFFKSVFARIVSILPTAKNKKENEGVASGEAEGSNKELPEKSDSGKSAPKKQANLSVTAEPDLPDQPSSKSLSSTVSLTGVAEYSEVYKRYLKLLDENKTDKKLSSFGFDLKKLSSSIGSYEVDDPVFRLYMFEHLVNGVSVNKISKIHKEILEDDLFSKDFRKWMGFGIKYTDMNSVHCDSEKLEEYPKEMQVSNVEFLRGMFDEYIRFMFHINSYIETVHREGRVTEYKPFNNNEADS